LGLAEDESLTGGDLAGWSGEELVHDERIIASCILIYIKVLSVIRKTKISEALIKGFGFEIQSMVLSVFF
jgi:hypothetical protein